MSINEWEWMRKEIKKGRDLKEETQNLYDNYYSRKSKADSMKAIVYVFVCTVITLLGYLLFKLLL